MIHTFHLSKYLTLYKNGAIHCRVLCLLYHNHSFQVSSLYCYLVVGKRDGLSIKLIHRDSVESPLYVANQTVEEILATLSERSSVHIKQITTATTNQTLILEQIIPPVVYDGEYYLAHVGIGTFRAAPGKLPYKSYYLMVDNASSFIWLQCEGCNPCYTQKEPFYPYSSSSTYHALSCQGSNHNCVYGKCDSGTCVYNTNYASKSFSKGDVSTERFTFRSDNGAFETVDNLYFGCGLSQKDFNFHVNPSMNEVSGIMGLARGPMSLLSQLGVRARNQFSYYLQPRFNGNDIAAISTSLQFGSHVSFKPWHRAVKVTPLLNPTNRFNYFVDLQGISLAGTRLNFNADVVSGKGGVVLDLGSPLRLISRQEYSIVRGAMWQYFTNMGLVETRKRRMDLCFNNPEGFNQIPSMTFYFNGGADLRVLPQQLFLITLTFFCSVIVPHNNNQFSVLIGAHMQANYRFVYRINARELAFARKDCEQTRN